MSAVSLPLNSAIPARITRFLSCFFAVIFLSAASSAKAHASSAQSDPVRVRYNFNSAWKLYVGDASGAEQPNFDDSQWQQVTLPHAWNEDAAFRVSIHDLPTGIAWYRKHFVLPPSANGKKIFLEFEGIRQAGDFYLNGHLLGSSENGVMAFGFDVTAYALPAPSENILAARIDNSWTYQEKATGTPFQWSDKNFYANYGGINKNVYLHVTGKLYQTFPLFSSFHTTGAYIYATDFNIPARTATIHAESQIKNDDTVSHTFDFHVTVRDLAGQVVRTFDGEHRTLAPGELATVSAAAQIKNLHFWSWGYGYLYSVTTTLTERGRLLDSLTTKTGFRKTQFANGMFLLNDRVLHLKGYAQRTTNEWPALGLSVPPWVSDFSNGLMVEGNANLVRWMHVTPWKQDVESCDRVGLLEAMPAGDSERDATGQQWEQRKNLMRDSILYNRNNPSIIFYESGNKGISEEHMADMKRIRDEFDPHGGRAIGAREMLGSKIAEYGGEMLYINKSAAKPLWSMEFSRDEGARKFWDNLSPPFHQDSPDYNRNMDSHALEDVRRWYDYFRERPGTGKRVNSGGVNIIFSDSNTHFRGDNNYRRSGEVDAMRIPKDGFYADQVMWDGWVDTERPRIHILGHWNYEPGTKKDVQVICTAQTVELFLNGRSLGIGESSIAFLHTFQNVAWQNGVLRAVGYDAQHKLLCETQLRTTGAPIALRLTPHTGPAGWRADGADLTLVDVEVLDSNGERVPTALNLIHFSLTGPAEWRGGIAQGPDNYILAKDLPVEGGINRISLRSTALPGTIHLEARADGLQPASIVLHTKPVTATQGLSLDFPADRQPSRLGRGPTPPTPSFHPSRFPIEVAEITAGANQSDAAKSMDDDETTSWKNDGHLDTAWIEYRFAEPQPVSELTLKLTGWRLRSYPLRITLDGKTVFEGPSPTSLGYITLPLQKSSGTRLRIALTAPTSDHDAFGKIIEITGAKDALGTGADEVHPGATLSIIECEIYR